MPLKQSVECPQGARLPSPTQLKHTQIFLHGTAAIVAVHADGKQDNHPFDQRGIQAGHVKDAQTVIDHSDEHCPQQGPDEDAWGLEPVFSTDEVKYDAAIASGKYAVLPMIGFGDITAALDRVDLLHVDIQGGERSLVAECIDAFSDNVAFAVISTHSRQIEGELFAHFLEAGWLLEIERPALLDLRDSTRGPYVTVDGVQGWRNPRLF